MNKKVLQTLLILTIIYLVFWYFLKFFFPEEFVLTVNNEKVVLIGQFIDSHKLLRLFCGGLTTFATYYLYLCATLCQKKLNKIQIVAVLIACVLGIIVNLFKFQILSYYHIFAMIILPALFNSDSKKIAFVFTFHSLCQQLSLSIRNISSMMLSFDFMSGFIMTLECYAWLFLWYIYFNYKENLLNG
jgi:hypothetical protein